MRYGAMSGCHCRCYLSERNAARECERWGRVEKMVLLASLEYRELFKGGGSGNNWMHDVELQGLVRPKEMKV